MRVNFNNIKTSRYYLVILLITFIIYGNGINNEYSLDDNIIVDRTDSVVEKGLKAIPKIFKSRYAKDEKQVYDYRPITTVSFAIEKQFFKKLPPYQTQEQKKKKDELTQANISHFINVLLYAITCILIFQVLKITFKDYSILLTIIITLLYLIHPLHTEVVDNIKSRDEILMFLFMLLSIRSFYKFEDLRKVKYLIFACVFVLLSLLSKKNGIAIFAVLPVLLYFKGVSLKRFLYPALTLVVVIVSIKLIKKGLLEKESLRELQYFENPLLYVGSFMDKITVGLYCSWFYLKMLVFPIDLSYYYGYNQIPMATWKYWEVWASVLFYVPLGVYGVIQFLKRKVLGLGIVLWLGLMLMVVNVLFPIVGIVAERFTYSFSLGFCIVLGVVILKAFKIDINSDNVNLSLPKPMLMVMAVIVLAYSGRTIARNPDWHDYLHTYTVDIDNVPNSAKAHSLIANSLYNKIISNRSNPKNKGYVEDVIYHYKEAISIDSTYLTCYCNLGSAYIDFLNDNNNGMKYSKIAVEMDPDYLEANYNLATAYDRLNMPDSAYKYYLSSIKIDPSNLANYNPFNEMLKKNGMVDKGIADLIMLANESESPKFIYTDIANLYSLDNTKVAKSVEYFEKAFAADPTDMILCNHLIGLFQKFGNNQKLNYYRSLYK